MRESHNINKKSDQKSNRLKSINTRWPTWLALIVVALLYEALPKIFYWGPRGLLIGLVTILLIPLIITQWRNDHRVNRILALAINILITIYTIISVIRLVLATFQGQIGPNHLLVSSIILWTTNILVFALWYWSLDAGGPVQRELKESAGSTAFLFPQIQISLTETANIPSSIKNWVPNFVDYLFLAFNTTTAFSPTDTPVLTRWAKCMCMIQTIISLTIILMLAARAINTLNSGSNYFVS
ncbi:hypothetical protein [Legionella fallonii]|uniref:Putative membrane protein n=1 Tax=Legionella fallonii LLAP-10 TaxID=1212491 RepID=A0A098G3S1_9GAMM|nr:hypothetical protein [Legionella fallonii]CEG56621.1 putative membrane protein [Legionella fallonii LLAP-10]